MLLQVYPRNEKTFATNGEILHNVYDDVVSRGDGYRLTFKMTLDKNYDYQKVLHENIIAAKTPNGMDYFRVFDIYKKTNHIEVTCLHVYYDLAGRKVNKFEIKNLSLVAAINTWKNHFSSNFGELGFNFTTDIMDTFSYVCEEDDQDALTVLTEMIEKVDGQIVTDGFNIRIVKNIGRKTGALLYEKKNISDFSDESSLDSVITRVLFRSKFTPSEKIPGPTMGYPNMGLWSMTKEEVWTDSGHDAKVSKKRTYTRRNSKNGTDTLIIYRADVSPRVAQFVMNEQWSNSNGHLVNVDTIWKEEHVKDNNKKYPVQSIEISSTIDSPKISTFAKVYESVLENNDLYTYAQVEKWVNEQYSKNKIDQPRRTLTISTNIIDGQEINFGDEVTLKYLTHGVDDTLIASGYEYAPIGEKYISVTLDSAKKTFVSKLADTTTSANKEIEEKVTKQLEEAVVTMSANEYNRTAYGPFPVPKPIEGDLWFYHPEGNPNDVTTYIFINGDWVKKSIAANEIREIVDAEFARFDGFNEEVDAKIRTAVQKYDVLTTVLGKNQNEIETNIARTATSPAVIQNIVETIKHQPYNLVVDSTSFSRAFHWNNHLNWITFNVKPKEDKPSHANIKGSHYIWHYANRPANTPSPEYANVYFPLYDSTYKTGDIYTLYIDYRLNKLMTPNTTDGIAVAFREGENEYLGFSWIVRPYDQPTSAWQWKTVKVEITLTKSISNERKQMYMLIGSRNNIGMELANITLIKGRANEITGYIPSQEADPGINATASKVTQLANLLSSQLLDSNGNVVSQVTLNNDRVKIQSKLINLDGDVTMNSSFAKKLVTNHFTTDVLQARQAELTNLVVSNLDANKVNAKTASFVTAVFNGVNSNLKMTSKGIQWVSTGSNHTYETRFLHDSVRIGVRTTYEGDNRARQEWVDAKNRGWEAGGASEEFYILTYGLCHDGRGVAISGQVNTNGKCAPPFLVLKVPPPFRGTKFRVTVSVSDTQTWRSAWYGSTLRITRTVCYVDSINYDTGEIKLIGYTRVLEDNNNREHFYPVSAEITVHY